VSIHPSSILSRVDLVRSRLLLVLTKLFKDTWTKEFKIPSTVKTPPTIAQS